jgi:SWI/SNF-related matrix-associated actin-dependent regulator 1 of chromatin subfamily A
MADVAAAKTAFNDDPDVRVILLQVQASKFGHTLLGDQDNIGDRCSTMIFYENSWSLDDRSQIEDRIHRMGQKASSCLYIDFVGSGMDEEIIGALQHKEDVYQAVMGIKRRHERRQEAAE